MDYSLAYVYRAAIIENSDCILAAEDIASCFRIAYCFSNVAGIVCLNGRVYRFTVVLTFKFETKKNITLV